MYAVTLFVRNCIFWPLGLAATAGIALTIILLAWIPGTQGLLQALEKIWARVVVWASGIDIQTKMPHLDPGQTYLFVANHQSLLDIPILLCVFRQWYPRFVAKDTLFKVPLFGPGMRRTGHLGVNRENSRQGMRDMQQAVHRLQQGQSLVIFPEGTREQVGEGLQDFHIGAFVIALKARVPIVPLVINGSGRIVPKGRLRLTPGGVEVCILDPREIPESATMKDRTQLKNALWAEMDRTLREKETWTRKND